MRPRIAAAFVALATMLSARPAAAAPIDQSIGMLSNNAAYFQSMVNAIDGSGRRTSRDSAAGGLIGDGHAGRLYAVGGAAMLGVVAAFILGSRHANEDELLDPPAVIPGDGDPGTGGTHPDVVNPDLPPGVNPNATTVTPEPGSLLLLSSGLSTLGAATLRRRRKIR
jgi:hypothetical protein